MSLEFDWCVFGIFCWKIVRNCRKDHKSYTLFPMPKHQKDLSIFFLSVSQIKKAMPLYLPILSVIVFGHRCCVLSPHWSRICAVFFFLPGAEQSVDLHTIAAWPLHQWWFPMLAGCLWGLRASSEEGFKVTNLYRSTSQIHTPIGGWWELYKEAELKYLYQLVEISRICV